jgi:hypothetical protein
MTGFSVGDFVQEVLVTDTLVYEVTATTAKTMTVRRTRDTGTVASENRDGNPYPVVYTGQEPDPGGYTRLVRLRKDGTYRVGSRPLRPAWRVDGQVVRYTDYRM